MGDIGPAKGLAFLDVLATCDEKTLYLHTVNCHFRDALTVGVDLAAV